MSDRCTFCECKIESGYHERGCPMRADAPGAPAAPWVENLPLSERATAAVQRATESEAVTPKPIQLFEPLYRTDECLAAIRPCLEAGWTAPGQVTTDFEEAWKRHTQLPHALFTNSATAGLHLALRVLGDRFGWVDGDEVITTPLTFVSTNHAILYEHLRPVFADVDEYLCLSPATIQERLSRRTRAVMFVGLGGNLGRLEAVSQFCADRGLALILDAAHMAGSGYYGAAGPTHVGTEADVTVFSFQTVKNLPTADGGMLCFRSLPLHESAKTLSWMGIDKSTYARSQDAARYKWEYDVPHLGYKYAGNAIMAALGQVALRYLEQDNDRRRQIAARYNTELPPWCRRIPQAPNTAPAQHLYQIRVEERDELLAHLNSLGIFPGVHYKHNAQYDNVYGYQAPTPNAERASRQLLSLPLHCKLHDADVARVIECIRSFRK